MICKSCRQAIVERPIPGGPSAWDHAVSPTFQRHYPKPINESDEKRRTR